MYKVRMHVEDYFMPNDFGRNNYGSHKVDCNKIICCFFNDEGKPRWEELFTIENLMEMTDFVLPKNKNKTYIRMKYQQYAIKAVNWLCEEHALNVLQVKCDIGKNRKGGNKVRVCYGFSKHLQTQADNIDRKLEFRNTQIERTKNRKITANKKSLKLVKHEGEQCLERKAII
jgi:hypothetical protein